MKYNVAGVEVELTGETRQIFGTGNEAGSAIVSSIRTPDQLVAEVQLRDFGPNDTLLKLTDFISTPPPLYDHLNRNGAMTVQRLDNGDWAALLRALRPGGKSYPTLNFVSMDELSWLLGDDANEWLEGLGFQIGTWEQVNPNAKKFKDSVAVSIPAEKANLLVLPWTLTRVVALMKGLGQSKVVDL